MLSIQEINLLKSQNEGLKKQNESLQKENKFLKEQNYLTTASGAEHRAKAMLLADMANGVLDEFYRFTK